MGSRGGAPASSKKKSQGSILSFFKKPKTARSFTRPRNDGRRSKEIAGEETVPSPSVQKRGAKSGGSDSSNGNALQRPVFRDPAVFGEPGSTELSSGKRYPEDDLCAPRASKRAKKSRLVKRADLSDSENECDGDTGNGSDESFKVSAEDASIAAESDDDCMEVEMTGPERCGKMHPGLDLPGLARPAEGAPSENKMEPSIPSVLEDGRENARKKLAVVDVKTKGKKVAEEGEWVALHPWARDIRDSERRRPGDPGYDPTTLYVPQKEFSTQGKQSLTPGQKQYWAMKMQNYDVLLFVKKGKFYELYDLDADLVHKELNLTYSRCSGADMHCVGIPERNFNRHASKLLDRGYKIGRVEQAETANAMQQRKTGATGKRPGVMERVLVRILTKATVTDEALLRDHQPRYVFSIIEEKLGRSQSASTEEEPVKVGVCSVDVACGAITMREFTDDFRRSETERLLSVLRPQEVLLNSNAVSKYTFNLLKWSTAQSGGQLLTLFDEGMPEMTPKWLSQYLNAPETKKTHDSIVKFMESKPLARRAFGAVTKYLKDLMIDMETLSLGNFSLLPDIAETNQKEQRVAKGADSRVQNELSKPTIRMDAGTLSSLEVLKCHANGSTDNSLLSVIDRASSQRGRRLLKRWLSAPLSCADDINDRLSAVDALLNIDANEDCDLQAISKKLASGKDIERALPRLHSYAVGIENSMMFDGASKRHVKEFMQVLRTLETALQVVDEMSTFLSLVNCKSNRLPWIVSSHGGIPSDARLQLSFFFDDAFDVTAAEQTGEIIPVPGTVPEYDKKKEYIAVVEEELDEMLTFWKRKLGLNSAKFVHRNSEKYQMEFSANGIKGKIPKEFELVSQTKALKRFYTPSLRNLIKKYVSATEAFELAGNEVARDILIRFNQNYNAWSAVSNCTAELDALIGLARASQGDGSGPMCRPTVLPNSHSVPVFHATQLRHPVLARSSTSFIANDVSLGDTEPNIAILTGPNAGGKSTLSRQVALCVLLAQVGCYAPAETLTLRPFDDIFVRMGASDDVSRGLSTFMMEMEDVSNILQNATSRSICLLDEVGRGTSTFDGYAIAFAALQYLASHTGCIGVFSTHYSMLGRDIAAECDEKGKNNVGVYEMAACVDEERKQITFLYKFQKGVSSQSRGICCARLAGIPGAIADNAEVSALEFEGALASRLDASSLRAAIRGCSSESSVATVRVLDAL